MKTRIVIGSLVATMMTLQVWAQRAENDDMYFTSKDRVRLKSENASSSVNTKIDNDYKAFKKKHFDKEEEAEEIQNDSSESVNPTDSYSAKNVNPEYVARSNSEKASEEEQNYYQEGYTANTYDSYSAGNNYNNWNNYNNGWYSPYNSAWNNPYNCMSCYNPYGGSGWNLSFGYGWGSWNNPWNNGWGSYNPYYGYYSPYSYYSPYYSGWGYPNYYYGSREVTSANYGKRPSRHSAVVTPTPRAGQRGNVDPNGRVSNIRTRQTADEYYVKPARRTSTFESSTDRTTERSRPSIFDTDRSRTGEYSAPRESRPTYSPSRSSSSPSRSSSSGSSRSSSSGSRRGRD